MIAYLCNCCKQPLDMKDEDIVHLEIREGERAVTSAGQYGGGWSADLCSDCWQKIVPMIGSEWYHGGNKYLPVERKLHKSEIRNAVMAKFDMQDMYLPIHFLQLIDEMEG